MGPNCLNGPVEEEKRNCIDYNAVLKEVGAAGRYQIRILAAMFFIVMAAGAAVVSFAFTGYKAKYRCAVPYCEDVANASYFKTEIGPWDPPNPDYTLPDFANLTQGCLRHVLDIAPPSNPDANSCQDYLDKLNSGEPLETEQCGPEDLIFDHSIVQTSISQQFGFVCDKAFLRDIFNALYMIGMLLGSFIMGFLSDHFGRKAGLFASVVLVSVSGFLCSVVNSAGLFALFRVMVGIGGMGCFLVPFIMVAESTMDR